MTTLLEAGENGKGQHDREVVDVSPLGSEPFSNRTADAIEEFGGVIFELDRLPIVSQRRAYPAGNSLKDLTVEKEGVLKVVTDKLWVAVFPDTEFVHGSFGLNPAQQVEMLPNDTLRLAREIDDDGFTLIVPDAPLATEVALRHYEKTNHRKRILGHHTATTTSTPGGSVRELTAKGKIKPDSKVYPTTVMVGYFNPSQENGGLHVYRARDDHRSKERGLMRVAVARPAQNR